MFFTPTCFTRAALLGILGAVVLGSAGPSSAADERNVTVVNRTGYAIKFLGFNTPDDDEWSDNELGGVLSNGEKIYVKFNEADKGCVWNIRVDWANYDESVLWRNVNLCKIETLTLRYNKDTDITSFTAE